MTLIVLLPDLGKKVYIIVGHYIVTASSAGAGAGTAKHGRGNPTVDLHYPAV